MNFLQIIFYVVIFICCINCKQNKASNSPKVSLVNLEKVDSSYIVLIKSTLENNFKIDTIIIVNQQLPEETYYKPRNRYRADKLIKYLKENYKSDKVIGITNKDISTTVREHDDWGIMGLAYRPGRSCVVSTFRTFRGAKSEEHKNERLKKVTMHEFVHTLGLSHCEDSKSCLMRDANGKVVTVDETKNFCDKCKSKIKKYLKSEN